MTKKVPTIDKIISASIELFHKNTYANTTLQDISKASGAAIGSIYHAFPEGKKDIAKAISAKYEIENNKQLGSILRVNAVNSTIEEIIDSLIQAMMELGDMFPCYYDSGFKLCLKEIYKVDKHCDSEDELLEYITILFQLKFPNLSKQEAQIKARICNNIWNSLLEEYDLTQDKEILKQLKIITLKYLQD
jgi:AcrR family transcriptional regulator